MSTTIDQKVLEMRFDNKQFEQNVSESISTLDKLKSALNLDKVGDAFSSVSRAAGKVDLSPIGNGIETVILKFNALELAAVQALANIITNGIQKLQSAINSLTFDQIGAGWEKYEQKTKSVQTIMAATGLGIEEVNEQLERLNWFSDETSYSFTDMTSNVGKFTSVGVDLETAVTAMQGISTWAALAGADVPEASRAMYNLSQAMGVGAVKLMDWKSIENAGMATSEFKETVLDTAAAMGVLRKYTDGTYQTLDGTTVSVKNFNSTLADGWFSSEVLLEALDAYGGFANELAKTTEEYGGLTSNWVAAIDEFGTGTDALNELMEDTNLSAEQLIPILQKLAGEEYELGRKAFKAAQEAKTFTDMIEATKDAVSTQWMNTFEYMFGDYEEAKEFFTEMTEIFYDLFAESGNTRNEILEQWSEDGFGERFRSGILDIMNSVDNIVNFFRNSFQQIFPEATVQSAANKLELLTYHFKNATLRLEKFTSELKLSDSAAQRFRSVFDGIGAVFDIFKQAFSALSPVFSAVKNIIVSLADDILTLSARFGDWLVNLSKSIRENDTFGKAVSKVGEVISPVINKVKELYSAFKEKLQTGDFISFEKILGKIGEKLKPVKEFFFGKNVFDKDSFINGEGPLKHVPGLLENIGKGFSTVWGKIKEIDLSGLRQGFSDFFGSVRDGLKNAFKDFNIGTFLSDLGKGISNLMESLGKGDFSKLFSNLTKGTMLFGGFNLARLFGSGSKALENLSGEEGGFLKGLLSPVTDTFDQLKETIGSFTKNTDSGKLTSIAIAIGVLAAALVALSSIDSDKMDVALTGLVAAFASLSAEMKYLSTLSLDKRQTSGLKSIGWAMIEIAAAVAIMVQAVKPLTEMEWGDLAKAGAGLTAIMGLMAAFTAVFGAISRANTQGITDQKGGFFSLFQKSNGFDKQMIKVAEAMILLGAAMKIFVSAMQGLGGMSWESLGKGIAGITAVMIEMLAFVAVASKLDTSGIMGTALAMVVLGAAMKVFESVIKGLGQMETDQAKQGIIAMTAVMVEMLAFIFIGSKIQASAGHIAGLAASMIVLGIAMKTFASAMQEFAKMEPGSWIDPIKQMGLVLVGMLAFMITANAVAASAGQILVISASMIVLGLAMKTFASAAKDFSTVNWEDLGKMGASMAGFIAILTAMGLLVGPLGAAVGILTGIGVALMAIGAGLTLIGIGLAAINIGLLAGQISMITEELRALMREMRNSIALDNLIKIIELIPRAIMGAITGAIAGIISGFGLIISAFGDLVGGIKDLLLSLIDLLVEIAPPLIEGFCVIVVDALASLAEHLPEMIVYIADIFIKLLDGLIEYLPQIVESLVKFLCKLFDSLKAHIPELLASFMDFVGVLFGEIMKALNAAQPDAVLKMIEFVGFLDVLIVSCAALKTVIPGAMAGLVELAAFVGELGLAIAALGTIYNDSAWLREGIEAGGNFLEDIGQALGKFVGGFVGGTVEGYTDSLPQVGTNLSDFWTNITPFIEGIKGVDSSVIESIGLLAASILALVAADLIEGITSFFSGGSSFQKFGTELAAFGPKFRVFANSVNGVNASSLKAASEAIKTIAETFNADVFKSGGLKQLFTGETSLTSFAEGLATFGPKLKDYADSVKEFDDTGIEKSSSAIASLATAFNRQVYKSGGLAQLFTGEMNLNTFAEGLSTFGPKLVEYGKAVSGFDNSGIETSTAAITSIATAFNNDVFLSGGLRQWVQGQVDFSALADGLAKLGPSLYLYSASIRNIDDNIATKSTTICTALSTMLNDFPKKNLIEEFFGTDGVTNFVESLQQLGTNLKTYFDTIKDIDTDHMGSVTTAMGDLINAVSGNDLFYVDFSETFGSAMKDAATTGLNDFLTAFDEIVQGGEPAAKGKVIFDAIVTGLTEASAEGGFKTAVETPVAEGLTAITEKQTNYQSAAASLMTQMKVGIGDNAPLFTAAIETALKEGSDKIVNSFMTFFDNGVALIDHLTTGVGTKKSEAVNKVKEIVSEMLKALNNKKGDFNTAGISLMTSFGSGIESAGLSVAASMYNIGAMIAQGLADGMNDNAGAVQAAAESLANAAASAASSTLEVNSPSKVFYQIGAYVGEGFVNGMDEWIGRAETKSEEMGKSVISAVSEALAENIQNDIDKDPVIRPVLDLSDVEKGSKRLNTIFSANTAMKAGIPGNFTHTGTTTNSINNSKNFGGFTFNIYPEGGNAEEIARHIGVEVNRRIRQFSTI